VRRALVHGEPLERAREVVVFVLLPRGKLRLKLRGQLVVCTRKRERERVCS
jgi:hypothetical protein